MGKLKIADMIITLDVPEEYMELLPYMPIFACDDSVEKDAVVDIVWGTSPKIPEQAENIFNFEPPGGGKLHRVYTLGEDIYYSLFSNRFVAYIKYKRDYKHFTIYTDEHTLNEDLKDLKDSDREFAKKYAVRSAVRRSFLMIMASRGGFELHSSSILYKGEAVLFSAMSGTGKTTHTNLWRETFPGEVDIINGDVGLCINEPSGLYIHGWPWCGTSECCMNVKAPIKALVFIERAEKNSITRLTVPEAFMRITSRCFMAVWANDLFMKTLDMVENVAESVDCYLLKCLPNHDAARLAEREIFGS